MPRDKKTTKIETTAESYDHKQETPLRPDIGLQAQFRQKRDPKKYRYDSSLSPELSWDINAERGRAEALIANIRELKTLEETKKAATLRWVKAVNNDVKYGLWDYRIIHEPTKLDDEITNSAQHLASLKETVSVK